MVTGEALGGAAFRRGQSIFRLRGLALAQSRMLYKALTGAPALTRTSTVISMKSLA